MGGRTGGLRTLQPSSFVSFPPSSSLVSSEKDTQPEHNAWGTLISDFVSPQRSLRRPLNSGAPFSIFVSDDFFRMKNSYDLNLPAVVCLFLCIFVSICLSVSMSVYLIVCLFAHLLGYISLHASVLTGRQIGTQKDKHTTRLY